MARNLQQEVVLHDESEEGSDYDMEESQDPLQESGCTIDGSDEEEVDELVQEDIDRFAASFEGITKQYRLINRIGEGTFSTVYKAEDLLYDHFENDWDIEEKENNRYLTPNRRKEKRQPRRRAHYVAIKKIYATSSPIRILNELELLHDLRKCPSVCPLITAFRDKDQVIAILPYFQHRDFRDYFREMSIHDMRLYFQSLITALSSVHRHSILHRDIKPTNFLYSPEHARGVLVDFGLAEREGTDWHTCLCAFSPNERMMKQRTSIYAANQQEAAAQGTKQQPSYPKNDSRPSRRANRAGTRGFRAPEVLLKCTMQTCAIDMWSVGVVLLTLLAKRFPFFHSADDIDALLELTNVFGRKRIREAAIMHGQVFETNIPSYSENGYGFEKIILWCTERTKKDANGKRIETLDPEEVEAIRFLERLLDCDPQKRITADEALQHPFILAADHEDQDDVDFVSP
ncbi:kinase-like protein [Pseudovirgaria hyperparasitica]|uniref:non-specific serine/threonine protein kinase n=1 Tax=Pseudovirgaria hyperparasitica TaxID=470096 RepID=A0A6A6VVS9_9PEZI|nr:kinase-like protein [Pseudovirgaria hyperparasitica]KAF2753740.1 kinase-like protein [Pseudovirgaria hyperparasitica]